MVYNGGFHDPDQQTLPLKQASKKARPMNTWAGLFYFEDSVIRENLVQLNARRL
jgi:hypothetical protein